MAGAQVDRARASASVCQEDGCERPRYGHGWCQLHWDRWRRTGDPAPDRPAQPRSSDSYWVARANARRAHGRADRQRCADCGTPAQLWSYDGTDPAERIDPARGYFYSLDPGRYRARCRSCHRRATTELLRHRDRTARPIYRPVPDVDPNSVTIPTALRAPGGDPTVRAVWLYERGVSLRGIAEELAVSPSTAGRLLRAAGVTIRPPGRRRSTGHRSAGSSA